MRTIERWTVRLRRDRRWVLREVAFVRVLARATLVGGSVGGLTGCGSLEPVPVAEAPITDATQLYTRLTLNYPAVTLSTEPGYNTVQLTAIPRAAAGNAMPDLLTPTYRSSDTTRVRVTADGLVTAVAVTAGTDVTVSVTLGRLTRVAKARIKVTTMAEPPRLASLSIHPTSDDDSTIVSWQPYATSGDLVLSVAGLIPSVSNILSLQPTMTDENGVPIVNLPVAYTALDPDIGRIVSDEFSGEVMFLRPGQVRLVAETMAYGISKTDTVTYTVTLPILYTVGVQGSTARPLDFTIADSERAWPPLSDIRIAPYGMVIWQWSTSGPVGTDPATDTVDVTFDDPTNVREAPSVVCNTVYFLFFARGGCGGTGNVLIPPMIPGGGGLAQISTMQIRQFPVPGIYPYHSTRLGVSGRVIVTNDPGE